MSGSWRTLERVGEAETAERIAQRLGIPYVLEYDLGYFRRLRHREIADALADLQATANAGEPTALARRGRVRRLAGDSSGARADFEHALELNPGLDDALSWLGELELGTARAEPLLAAAAERRPAHAATATWLALARILNGKPGEAARDLADIAGRSRSGFAMLVLGAARERAGAREAACRAYARAARLEPACAAAHWLISRLRGGAAGIRAAQQVFAAQPGYAFLAQFMLFEEKNWTRTIERLRRFAFADPEKACFYDRQDDLLYSPFHEDEYRDATEMVRAVGRRPWIVAMIGRAALRCPAGSPRRAEGIRALFRAAEKNHQHGWLVTWRGLAKLARGDDRGALADFNRGLALQPCYHRAYAWRGALLGRMGRHREAARDLDVSIAIDEGYVFAYHQRSLVRRAVGDWLGASADLERAFEFDSRYHWAFSSGREPREADFARAAKELDAALRIHPDHSGLLAWRGQLRLREVESSHALPDLERATALDPSNALAQAWLGRAWYSAGHPRRALAAARRAHELRPMVEIYRLWLAEAEQACGEGRSAQRRLKEIPPGRRGFEALATRARLKLADGDARGALHDAAACLRVRGRSAEAYYLRALAQRSLGRWREARISAEMALYASAHHGQARLVRAEALVHAGRAEEAVAEYGVIEKNHPYLLNEEQRRRWKELLAA